jgi:hypothetical protein
MQLERSLSHMAIWHQPRIITLEILGLDGLSP